MLDSVNGQNGKFYQVSWLSRTRPVDVAVASDSDTYQIVDRKVLATKNKPYRQNQSYHHEVNEQYE